jgi:hypothetical protein
MPAQHPRVNRGFGAQATYVSVEPFHLFRYLDWKTFT